MLKHAELYMSILDTLSKASKDERLKVGAILLKDGRIIATGYNGQLPGLPHEQIIVNNHDISTCHAEQNIISFCAKHGISTNNCTLLVTHFPCQLCTKSLIQSGINKVYYIDDYKNEENPFAKRLFISKLVIPTKKFAGLKQ